MEGEQLETGVDDFMRCLEDGKKHSLQEIVSSLNIDMTTLQLWVDFLVEEKIIGVEYSFTKPFVFLNQPKNVIKQEEVIGISYFKDEFYNAAKLKKIPENKIEFFWKRHITDEINRLKELFMREARKRHLKNVEVLWNNYKEGILVQ